MSNSDIQRAMDDIVDSCFDLRGRIMDAEAAAEAAKQVDDKPPAKVSSDPALENVFKAVKSGVGAASENKDTIATVLDTLVKHVDPSISVPSAGEIGSALNKASTLVEFAQLIAKTSDAGSKGVKAATRFLAANGLEIASTIVNVAKVAADFVPVPGLGIAIGIIDKILKNIGDSRDAPKIMQAFCDALGEIKAIIAPMANQWFSADVQSKCSDLVALLKEANAAVERAKADAKTWRALLGGASTKMAAQVESLRKKLGKIKELLSLAMQVDSAMMLMRMAEQLNIIDVKADKMLALLRPRTLLLRHDDFMIAPKPLDSSGSFRVFEAKMDGSPFVIKEFHDGIEGREDDLEAEAHRWFNANHPNLLQLTGICLAKDKQTVRGPFIALPFVEYDLESLVKDHPDLSQDNKLRILLRIARGLKYLHEQAPDAPIVHGSLTMRHVRVEIKERMVDDVREIQVTKVLIVPAVGIGKPSKTDSNADAFAAPEASKAGSKPDAKHDIFSFGVMALSIVLGKEPAQVRTSYLDNPEGFDRQLFDLFIQAKMQIPNIRPNLDQFISRLNNKLKMEPELARPGASDIELLCAAFPDWTRDSGITLSSNNPHGDLVFIFDTTTQRSTVKWRLDWDAEHNLTALWLDQNELHGEIPAKLFGLRNLTSLRIGQNKLRGPISTRISKLTQLVELDISGCGLDEIPDALASLKQLKILNLSGNNIKELPEQIGEMQLLEILNLSHTKQLNGDSGISDLPADIGRLANLTELYAVLDINLDGNRINELPESIGDLAHLEKL
nr:hypothetical protein HK105_001153 [Polyrhizophydium stewartii]